MKFREWLHTIFGKISSKKSIGENIEYGQTKHPLDTQVKDELIDIKPIMEAESSLSSQELDRLVSLKSEYNRLCARLNEVEEQYNQDNTLQLHELSELPRFSYDKICVRKFTPLAMKNFPNMMNLKKARKEEERYQTKIKEQEVTKHLGLASDYIGVGDCVKAHEELLIVERILHTIDKPEVEHRYSNLSKQLLRKEEECKMIKREKISEERRNKQREKEEKRRLLYNIQHKNTRWKSGYKIALNDFVDHGISYLYHFTSKANLKSIIEHGGLYAKAYHSKIGIKVLDKMPNNIIGNVHGVDVSDYICLSVCKEHYMAREQFESGVDICVLKINIDVVKYYNTYFADKDVSEENIRIGRECQDTNKINFDAIKNEHLTNTDFDYSQKFATVLVEAFIPLCLIENIDNPLRLK